jgi:hypothetical protein
MKWTLSRHIHPRRDEQGKGPDTYGHSASLISRDLTRPMAVAANDRGHSVARALLALRIVLSCAAVALAAVVYWLFKAAPGQ